MAVALADGPARSIPARAGETKGRGATALPSWVYPRTGGGNLGGAGGRVMPEGLSPHGRGKLIGIHLGGQDKGSIPARAGETTPARLR